MELWVWGLSVGSGVGGPGSRSALWSSGSGVWSLGFWIWGLDLGSGLRFWLWGLGLEVWGPDLVYGAVGLGSWLLDLGSEFGV